MKNYTIAAQVGGTTHYFAHDSSYWTSINGGAQMYGQSDRNVLTEIDAPREGSTVVVNAKNNDEFTIDSLRFTPFIELLEKVLAGATLMEQDYEVLLVEQEDSPYTHAKYRIVYRTKLGDVMLTNSQGHKHQLRGMYAQACFLVSPEDDNGEYNVDSIAFARDVVDVIECIGGFQHSHTTTMFNHGDYNLDRIPMRNGQGEYDSWRQVCLGNSPLNNWVSYAHKTADFDMIEFITYIKNFVKWESLEGGPYRTIEDLYSKAVGIDTPEVTSKQRESFSSIAQDSRLQYTVAPSGVCIDESSIQNIVPDYIPDTNHYSVRFNKKFGGEDKVARLNATYQAALYTYCDSKLYYKGHNLQVDVVPVDYDEVYENVKLCMKDPNPRIVICIRDEFNSILSKHFNQTHLECDKELPVEITIKSS